MKAACIVTKRRRTHQLFATGKGCGEGRRGSQRVPQQKAPRHGPVRPHSLALEFNAETPDSAEVDTGLIFSRRVLVESQSSSNTLTSPLELHAETSGPTAVLTSPESSFDTSDTIERVATFRQQIKAHKRLSRRCLINFEYFGEAVSHAESSGVIAPTEAQRLYELNWKANKAKHHNICHGAKVHARYGHELLPGIVREIRGSWCRVELERYDYWFERGDITI